MRLLDEVRYKQAAIDKLTREMAVRNRLKFAARSEAFRGEQHSLVSAGVNLTHLGEDGSFSAADDVDPGASSGDTSVGAKGDGDPGDREADGLLAQYGAALPARP